MMVMAVMITIMMVMAVMITIMMMMTMTIIMTMMVVMVMDRTCSMGVPGLAWEPWAYSAKHTL